MVFKSIRWQIQAWHGLLLMVVVVTLLGGFYQFEKRDRIRHLDEKLQQLLIESLPVLNPPPRAPEQNGPGSFFSGKPFPGGPPFSEEHLRIHFEKRGAWYAVWRDGQLTRRSPNAPADLGPAPDDMPLGTNLSRTRGTWRELLHQGPHANVVLIGVSQKGTLEEMTRFGWALTALGAAVLGFGFAGGWWLATRAIRPIEVISATVRTIAEGDLSGRIDLKGVENELGRLAQVLNRTFEQLQHAFEQQVRFSADASHELRTPVSVILSQAQLALSKERAPDEYRQALEICRRNAESMRSLVNALMELARLDGRLELNLENVDLSTLAKEVVEAIHPLAEENGVPLAFEYSNVALPVRIDRDKISRVILNLLSNAIRYNRPGGGARVSAGRDGDRCIWLRVSDTGPGIAPEHLPHLFERFYRVDKSRSRDRGGSGLGLAICQALVHAHGGEITVESVFGEGTTFTVKLPPI